MEIIKLSVPLFLSPTQLMSLMSSVTRPGLQRILKSMAASGTTKGDQQLVLPSKALSSLAPSPCCPVSFLAFLSYLLISCCALTGWTQLRPSALTLLLLTGVMAKPPSGSKSLTSTLAFIPASLDTSPDSKQATKHCTLSMRLLNLTLFVSWRTQPWNARPHPTDLLTSPLQLM